MAINSHNMRYLFTLLLIIFSFNINAQNRFPTIDSAKNYVLRFVKNSAVETFTNWRAQNVAYGTLELLDSLASDPAVDSIWKNGDTLRYRKAGNNYTVGIFTTQTPTLQQVTTAGNSTTDSLNIKTNTNILTASIYNSGSGGEIKLKSLIGPTEFVLFEEGFYFAPLGDANAKSVTFNQIENRQVSLLFPDSSGTLTQRIKVNGTTYNTAANGVVDLGTIQSDTATVVKAYVTNAEAVTITKGQVVYIFGAQGDRASVKLAKNTSDTFSSKTLGIVREDIAAGQAGWVTTQGQVSGINLGAYTAGDVLWLDSVPGAFTNVRPQAPYHGVFVGVVERANAGNGLIYVKPQNGVELEELHDVKLTSSSNNQVLAYTASTGIWENKSVTTALGYTPLNVTDTAAMLSPYLRSITAPSGAGINLIKGTSQIKRLKAGSNITITDNTDSVTIASTGGGGIQWGGVDSMFAKLSVENGYHHAEEFDVITGSITTTAFLNGTKYSFTAGGGNVTSTQDTSGVGARLGTLASSTAAPYIQFSHAGGNANYVPITNNDWNLWTCRIRIPTLNDGTERFYIKAGLANIANVTTPNVGLWFAYDLNGTMTNSAASANFQTLSAAAGVRTWNTTSNTVNANQWYKLAILYKAGVAYYYIDNVLVQTHTTNIPAAGTNLVPYFDIRKTNGTTARTYDIDYSTIDIKYLTPR